jgi:hypothetical protein
MDGKSTCSHDSEKFRTRSMEKQGRMAFGFAKTATAVIEPDRQIFGISNLRQILIYS